MTSYYELPIRKYLYKFFFRVNILTTKILQFTTNLKAKSLFFHSRVTNTRLRNKKINFELLTLKVKLLFFDFQNSKLKVKKNHFE